MFSLFLLSISNQANATASEVTESELGDSDPDEFEASRRVVVAPAESAACAADEPSISLIELALSSLPDARSHGHPPKSLEDLACSLLSKNIHPVPKFDLTAILAATSPANFAKIVETALSFRTGDMTNYDMIELVRNLCNLKPEEFYRVVDSTNSLLPGDISGKIKRVLIKTLGNLPSIMFDEVVRVLNLFVTHGDPLDHIVIGTIGSLSSESLSAVLHAHEHLFRDGLTSYAKSAILWTLNSIPPHQVKTRMETARNDLEAESALGFGGSNLGLYTLRAIHILTTENERDIKFENEERRAAVIERVRQGV